MSLQSDVVSYWQGNTALTSAIPFSNFWVGLAPEAVSFPYAVMVILGSLPTYVTMGTRDGYIETFSFQISIFDTNPDNALSVAGLVVDQFEFVQISAKCISVERTNGPLFVVDMDTPKLVYHAWVSFAYTANFRNPIFSA
jgi:hypothetical protein